LQAAVNAATSGDVVELQKDVEENVTINTENITVDLNNQTVSGNVKVTNKVVTIEN
jgi:lipopolysaccharide export system protein LptA